MLAAGARGKALRKGGLWLLAAGALIFALRVYTVVRAPRDPWTAPGVVNDVTQLNPVLTAGIVAPKTTDDIIQAVKRHPGPISIGGARHSMGGQIAASGSLHLDLRGFDRILQFSPEAKTITVQAGARWRQIQERIDPADLSVAIMQSYANFTVGGSLSVNAHGRYVGQGPIIRSVRSLRVVLADGSEIAASPAENADVFYGVIGGYGGLGVITEATLELADNVRIRRTDVTLPAADYRRYFLESVRGTEAIFHHGDLYPRAYDTVHAVTFTRTAAPVTIPDRLIPADQPYRLNRLAFWVFSEWPLGADIRSRLADPLLFRGEPVSWRNYEASYDTAELEPASRGDSTYALQEYFVPLAGFDAFVERLRGTLQRHGVNAMNVSLRHALPDPGSLLAWARTEVFTFVLYYKQETDRVARDAVGIWTRELIDAALETGGSYYLPYQIHATEAQFLRAYPRAGELFALKRRLDPTNKFSNALWERYYRASAP